MSLVAPLVRKILEVIDARGTEESRQLATEIRALIADWVTNPRKSP